MRRVNHRARPLACALSLFALVGPTVVPAQVTGYESRASGLQVVRKDSQSRATYIVRFREAPLAQYDGSDRRFPMPERNSDGRLNTTSASSEAYIEHLLAQQDATLAAVSSDLGRTVTPVKRYTLAINGAALQLSDEEAAALRERADVLAVEQSVDVEVHTDVGPQLIGADTLWNGSNALAGQSKGEGIVIGVIDSGINFDSPSFAAVEPASGYAHVNPLGSGNALGLCATGQLDAGKCNNKLIGAYDFVYDDVCTPASPTTDPCRASGGTLLEEPSATDNNGHGTHTAGTAGGNAHNSSFQGNTIAISGVAPHANLIIYDACYTQVSNGSGLCPTTSTLSSVEQAIADGLVDVINYSIGGGTSPWTESVSQAFLSATNAGILVSASAGNSGPSANTLGHVEPWVVSVGASTHTRSAFAYRLTVTGPGSPPSTLVGAELLLGTGGTAPTAALPGTTPLIVSAGFNSANDGCAAYPAGTFTGAIAVIRRGTCNFATKANNASAAGAITVVLANNTTGTISATVPGTTVPVYTVTQALGNAIRDFAAGSPLAASVSFPPSAVAVQADVMANFSSRGPNPFNLLKPDVSAPGVDVLAAYAGTASSYNAISGTSMAAPHVAGAMALLRALNPSWTPMEVKSALMLVGKTSGVTKEDATTPADPLDRGAGRIDLTRAAKVGLVMDESGSNFSAANPATGGEPSSLNLPSIQHTACAGTCSFTRRVRAARAGAMTYTLSLVGMPGTSSVSPSTFTINSSGTRSFIVSIDGGALSTSTYTFGEVVLTPSNGSWETLRMPIAVRGAPPEINVTSSSLAATITGTGTTTVDLVVQNLGNPGLTYTNRSTGVAPVVAVNQPYENSGTGFRSSLFTDTPSTSQYAADDFVVPAGGMTLHRIQAQGFNVAGSLAANASALSVFVFPDAGGKPAGDPSTSPGLATYSFQTTTTGTGVSVANSTIAIDLVAAGQNWALTPGTYWLVVRAHIPFANRWVWFGNTTAYGQTAQAIAVGATAPGNVWGPLTGGFQSLAMRIDRSDACGASWITQTTNGSGSVGAAGSATLQLTLDSTGLSPGVYQTLVCLESNDSDEPLTVVPVSLTVNGVPTSPALSNATAEPASVPVGGTVTLSVSATAGTFPTSTGLAVRADLSSIGGSATQALFDNGTNGDATAGDGRYTVNAVVAIGTSVGAKSIPLTVTDAQSRSGTTTAGLTVEATGGISGTGAATPEFVLVTGGNVLFTVNVAAGSGPASTGVTVEANLMGIGGLPVQPFFDDGSNGDQTPGDGVYSFAASVPAGMAAGSYPMNAIVRDAQLRTAAVNIGFAVRTLRVFGNSFEQ